MPPHPPPKPCTSRSSALPPPRAAAPPAPPASKPDPFHASIAALTSSGSRRGLCSGSKTPPAQAFLAQGAFFGYSVRTLPQSPPHTGCGSPFRVAGFVAVGALHKAAGVQRLGIQLSAHQHPPGLLKGGRAVEPLLLKAHRGDLVAVPAACLAQIRQGLAVLPAVKLRVKRSPASMNSLV